MTSRSPEIVIRRGFACSGFGMRSLSTPAHVLRLDARVVDTRRHDEGAHEAPLPAFGAVAARGGVGERPLTAHHQLVVDDFGCQILRLAARRVDLDHELVLRLPDVDGGQPAARAAVGSQLASRARGSSAR